MTTLISQKMGIHEWSYDNAITLDRRFRVPQVEVAKALKNLRTEVELGFDLDEALAESRRCLNCDVETVFSAPACIECDACVDVCPLNCISFVPNAADEQTLRDSLRPPAMNPDQAIYVSEPVKSAARHGQGRGPLPALRPVRRALSDRRLGHAKVHSRSRPSGAIMPIQAVNDFVIRFANINGSGSASANLLFARAILRMGVPIAPRNIFPSNIQGLPTWYEVRVSEKGYLGARGGADMLVAMNPQTFAQDVASIEPGGYLFYDSTRPMPAALGRDDIVVLGLPLTEICNAAYSDARQRQLYKNIIYVGALAALLDIERGVIEQLLSERFKGKDKLIEANLHALDIGFAARQRPLHLPARHAGEKERRGRRPHPRRRQLRRRPGRGVRRRHGVRVVSDHALDLARRGVRARRRAAIASNPRPARRPSLSFRRRTRSPRSAWRSAPAGTARAPSRRPRDRASR